MPAAYSLKAVNHYFNEVMVIAFCKADSCHKATAGIILKNSNNGINNGSQTSQLDVKKILKT